MSHIKTERVKPVRCPKCSQRNDAVTPVGGGRGPRAGDLTTCFRCGFVLQFVARADGSLSQTPLDAASLLDVSKGADSANDMMIIAHLTTAREKIKEFAEKHMPASVVASLRGLDP